MSVVIVILTFFMLSKKSSDDLLARSSTNVDDIVTTLVSYNTLLEIVNKTIKNLNEIQIDNLSWSNITFILLMFFYIYYLSDK